MAYSPHKSLHKAAFYWTTQECWCLHQKQRIILSTWTTFIFSSSMENLMREYFYQHGSIANYASTDIARGEMSVCPSICHTPVLYQNEERWFLHHRRAWTYWFLETSDSSWNSKGFTRAMAIYGWERSARTSSLRTLGCTRHRGRLGTGRSGIKSSVL